MARTSFGLKTYERTPKKRKVKRRPGRPRKPDINADAIGESPIGYVRKKYKPRRSRKEKLEVAVHNQTAAAPPGYVSMEEHNRRIAQEQANRDIAVAKVLEERAIKEFANTLSAIPSSIQDHGVIAGSFVLPDGRQHMIIVTISSLRTVARYLKQNLI